MLNKIFLQGRLVADPEMRHTPSGVAVATLRLAMDRDFKDRETGEKKADFINVVAWRATAEFVSRYFTKGRMAIVERDGEGHGSYGGSYGGGYSAPAPSAPVPPPAYSAPMGGGSQFAELDDDDGELPF